MLLVGIHEARITCFPASYPNMTRSRPERQSLNFTPFDSAYEGQQLFLHTDS